MTARRWVVRNSVLRSGVKVYGAGREVYPEVSGYFIPTLLCFGERDRAFGYARWLLSVQNNDGSWSDPAGKSAYTFDTGQILKGLIAVAPVLPEVDEAIRRGCNWMLTQILPDGQITTPDKTEWGGLLGGRTVSENIHLYALKPLREAARLFNESKYTDAVECALRHYLAKPDLITFNTLSHFHAYVIEALVDLGYADMAAKGMAEVARLQRNDGSVPAYPEVDWVCSPGLAQYTLIWYRLGLRAPADKAFQYLCRLQNSSGGFYGSYGKGANYFPDKEISWAVKYFLDANYWRQTKL